MPDEDTPWYVQLLISTAVLICVAILVGGIAAVASLTAADYVGITTPQTPAPESVVIPTLPTTSKTSPSGQRSPTGGQSTSPTKTRSPKPPQNRAITLTASPLQVPAYGQITLTGSYATTDGTTLQVQRQEAGGVWADFPVNPTVTGGTYSTYIETGRTGTNRIRIIDPATGATSNVVTVDVG